MIAMAQPQLLQIALDRKDVVYTPDWVARDMVEYFKPSGRILEPCAGDGAFLKYLPNADWCEIEMGRDFYAIKEHYDWMVGNPPYRLIKEWLCHSFNYSDNVLYLIPMNSPFNSMERMRIILSYGNIKAIRAYGNGSLFGMDYGFAVGAFWFKKNYCGLTEISYYEGMKS
jgi:hypothetical protein